MSKRILAIDMKSGLLTAVVGTIAGNDMQIIAHAVVPVAERTMEEALGVLIRGLTVSQGDPEATEASSDALPVSCCWDESHIAFEAEAFSFRNLVLPFTDSKTIARILPLELDDNAPVKMERLLVDALIHSENEGSSQIIAAMLDRELLARRLALLHDLGVEPERVTVSGVSTVLSLLHTPATPADYLLLTLDLYRACLVLVQEGNIRLIRPLVFDAGLATGFQFEWGQGPGQDIVMARPENQGQSLDLLCSVIRQTLQSFYITGEVSALPLYLSGSVGTMAGVAERIGTGLGPLCSSWTAAHLSSSWSALAPATGNWNEGVMADAVSLGWQAAASWRGFNFRKEAFAVKKSLADTKKMTLLLASPLLAAGLFALLYFWADYARMAKKQDELTTSINAIFTATVPEVTKIIDPIQQLQVKIKEVGQASMNPDGNLPSSTIVHLLAEVSATIPAAIDVRLARFVVDDTGLRIKGTTDTFNSVNAIKTGLEKSNAFGSVEIGSATMDAKTSKVRFELKLTMRESDS